MLHVRTTVKPSEIHGLGLFSKQKIKKGEVVWTFNPKLDQTFTLNYLQTIPDCVAEQIHRYGYVNPEELNLVVLCGDDARFMNFSVDNANLKLGVVFNGEHTLVAERDIHPGEELTVPPCSDADAARKLTSSI